MSAIRAAEKALSIQRQAEDEGRELTADEREEVEDLLAQVKLHRQMEDLDRTGRSATFPSGGPELAGSPGARFVESKGYKRIQSSSSRGQTWSSGPVDVGSFGRKGTLLGGTGGTLVPPQYVPGVVQLPSAQVGLSDYFGSQPTSSNSVRYAVEGTATSGAAGVAEGGAKPESTLALSEVDEPVKKIATTLPISDELLEDSAGVQTYINGRLTMFLRLERERQLLRGSGTNELAGLFSRGISTLGLGTATANHVQIFRAAAGIRGSASVDADLVVMHPDNWIQTRLTTDTAGQYLGGGPWQGAYGQPQAVGASYFTSAPLWGMSVFVSNVVGKGTALVGNFSESARIYRRSAVTVEATNSHSDFFVKDLSMIRAEERLALACFRPAAFCAVTTLSG